MDFHPYASTFPLSSAEELVGLEKDIRENGLLEPIVEFEGKILDGRNRFLACQGAGVDPHFVPFEGTPEQAIRYVWSENAVRRHLLPGQKAAAALKFEGFLVSIQRQVKKTHREKSREGGKEKGKNLTSPDSTKGGPTSGPTPRDNTARTTARVAEFAGVDRKTVEAVLRAEPEVQEKILTGETTVYKVEKERKRQVQQDRYEELKANPPKLPEGEFSLIYADPPWRYDFSPPSGSGTDTSPGVDADRSIESKYPTMTIDDIKSVNIPAADDCVLFLWATSPKLEESLAVISAWGFTYKTCAVWFKERVGTELGMGYYFRQQHELLLVATKGSPGVPLDSVRGTSVIQSKALKHSAKPEIFYEIIEKLYPGATRCELWARASRDGWISWGSDISSVK